jgi:two-component system phosphate regulon sensor histidine kinase PhoR
MRGGQPRTAELALVVQGKERTVRLHASPMKGIEGSRGAVLVIEDVSAQRRVDAMRRDFITNASHELKTPIASIRAIVETVLGDGGMDESTRREFLERVQRQADRMGTLLEEMLTLSRLEARGLPENLGVIDLRDAVAEAVQDAALLAAERDIHVRTVIEEAPTHVRADAESLHRIAGNLLDNAIKYSEPGRPVTVRVRTDPAGACLEVVDQGAGIPADKRDRIFERFYRLDTGRSREAGGTGLGLAIVKHLVQALGGRIEVESAPGQGSLFRVLLPRA